MIEVSIMELSLTIVVFLPANSISKSSADFARDARGFAVKLYDKGDN
jgi:catalase